jgi:Fe-S-cluster containining protein
LSQHPKSNTNIKEIYKELEAELANINPGCNACGTCCHFDEFGHVLYTSTIEIDYIRKNVEIPDFDPDKNVCPFLVNYECSIRDHRALGCRVFFCNPNHKETLQEIYEKYYTMIKDLADNNDVEWQYAPMLKLLEKKQQKNQL